MKRIYGLVLVLAVALSAVPARAWDSGVEIGFVGSKSVQRSSKGLSHPKSESDYCSYGLGLAYRWQLPIRMPVKLFLRPQVSAAGICSHYDRTIHYGITEKVIEHYFGTDFGIDLGINIYKGLSFYTGPQFRYTLTSDHNSCYYALNQKLARFWSFGLYMNVWKMYAMLKYCQNMNHCHVYWIGIPANGIPINRPTYRNKLELSIGYRF